MERTQRPGAGDAATPPSDVSTRPSFVSRSAPSITPCTTPGRQQRRPADWPVRNAGQRAGVAPRLRGPGGDSAFELMQADFSRHPEPVGRFVAAFLAMHHQRLRAEEDPVVTYSAAETQVGSIEPRWPLPSSFRRSQRTQSVCP